MTSRCSLCGALAVARRLCRKHYQAAWKRGDLGQHARAARPPANTICPPDHKHAASSTCYGAHRCRCDQCREGQRVRESRRRRQQAYGTYDSGRIDIAPVREHLLMLGEYGIGYRRAAVLAGVSGTVTRTILWGREDPGRVGEMQKRIKRSTAEKILAVEPTLDSLAGGRLVAARPYVRRVQALVGLGWSLSKIARRVGVSPANFTLVRRYESARTAQARNRVRISADLARRIVALYEEWSMMHPPEGSWHERTAATRSRRLAAERGWPLPLDWETVDGFDSPSPVRRSVA